MDYTQLIVTLLQLGEEFGPKLVHDIADLIHKNPTATVDQINAQIKANLAAAQASDAAIENGG